MNRIGLLLSLTGLTLLNGCVMLGGMGHTGHPGGTGSTHGAERQGAPPLQRAAAQDGELAISISLPAPAAGVAVPIDVQFTTGLHHGGGGEVVSLWIPAPGGGLEEVRMHSTGDPGSYRTHYRFPAGGRFPLMAEGRMGPGGEARSVSVTTEVVVREAGGRHDRGFAHRALVGLLCTGGMVAMMVAAAAL